MLASVRSATLLGRRRSRRHRRGPRVDRPARLHGRRAARHRRSASRASACAPRCCRRDLEFPQQRITVNLAPAACPQDRRRARARRRPRVSSPPTGQLAGRRASTASASSASSGSTGRSARCPACSRSSTRWPAAGIELGDRARDRRGRGRRSSRGVEVRAARTSPSCARACKGEEPWPEPPPTRRPSAAEPDLDDEPLDLAEVRGLPRRAHARSRSPRPAGTTCCSAGRPAPARRCSPAGCPRSCRPSTPTRRSRSPASTRPPASAAAGLARRGRSARRTTPRRPPPSSAAARTASAPARSRSRTLRSVNVP